MTASFLSTVKPIKRDCGNEQQPTHETLCSLSLSPVVTIGLDSMMYSVTEGESVTAVVSVMSDDVTLDRDVVVIVMTSDGTANIGIVYMPTCTCMVVEYCVWQWSAYMYNVAIVLCT